MEINTLTLLSKVKSLLYFNPFPFMDWSCVRDAFSTISKAILKEKSSYLIYRITNNNNR